MIYKFLRVVDVDEDKCMIKCWLLNINEDFKWVGTYLIRVRIEKSNFSLHSFSGQLRF